MTLDEVKKLLEKVEGGSAMLEAITDAINKEKETGITLHKKVNAEAAGLRKFKKALEAVGYSEDDDLDEFTANLIKVKTDKREDDGAGKLTLQTLQDQIKLLNTTLTTEREKAKQFELKSKKSKMSEKLTEALGDKVYGSKFFIQSLINDGRVDIEEDNVVIKLNDQTLDFKTGISKILEENKDIVKTNQNGGFQTTQSRVSSGDKLDISNMSPDQIARNPEASKQVATEFKLRLKQ